MPPKTIQFQDWTIQNARTRAGLKAHQQIVGQPKTLCGIVLAEQTGATKGTNMDAELCPKCADELSTLQRQIEEDLVKLRAWNGGAT
jgi:hypothetical protein